MLDDTTRSHQRRPSFSTRQVPFDLPPAAERRAAMLAPQLAERRFPDGPPPLAATTPLSPTAPPAQGPAPMAVHCACAPRAPAATRAPTVSAEATAEIALRRALPHTRRRWSAAETPAHILGEPVVAVVDTGSNNTVVPKHQALAMGL